MKQSGYAKRLKKEREPDSLTNYFFARQFMADIMQITLNREFGFGKDRIKRFCKAFSEMHDELASMWNSDSKDMEFTKHKIDEALKQIAGDEFVPWEERYAFKIQR